MAKKILLIEDELAIQESLRELLELKDYIVETASNGIEGLAKLDAITPDLIICDVMMPKMDGFEFLEKLQGSEADDLIPIIMLTARVELDAKLRGLELGADDYITKPFEFKELNFKIQNLLSKRTKLIERTRTSKQNNGYENRDDIFITKLNLILDEQIKNPKLNVRMLASEMNMSTSTLNRQLQRIAKKSPNRYIREFKLRKAKEMVEMNYGNVSEIAFNTGFNTVSYFSVSYKEFYGIPPSLGFKLK